MFLHAYLHYIAMATVNFKIGTLQTSYTLKPTEESKPDLSTIDLWAGFY